MIEWTAYDISAATFSGGKREILRVREPTSTHNVNNLAFDRDGLLYIAIGESTISSLTPDLESVFEKILRIDPLGSNSTNGKYGIPNSNLFVGNPSALGEIYAYGLRNPYRLSIDRDTGTVCTADVGGVWIEEINAVSAGGNYGWPHKEGSFVAVPEGEPLPDVPGGDGLTVAQRCGLIDSIADYDRANGTAVVGEYVYRGAMIPWLRNDYVFADFANLLGILSVDLDDDDPIAPGAHQDIYALNLDLSRSENLMLRNIG